MSTELSGYVTQRLESIEVRIKSLSEELEQLTALRSSLAIVLADMREQAPAPPAPTPIFRGVKQSGTQRVLDLLVAGGAMNAQAICDRLQGLPPGTVTSALFDLKKRGRIVVEGSKGSYTYRAVRTA